MEVDVFYGDTVYARLSDRDCMEDRDRELLHALRQPAGTDHPRDIRIASVFVLVMMVARSVGPFMPVIAMSMVMTMVTMMPVSMMMAVIVPMVMIVMMPVLMLVSMRMVVTVPVVVVMTVIMMLSVSVRMRMAMIARMAAAIQRPAVRTEHVELHGMDLASHDRAHRQMNARPLLPKQAQPFPDHFERNARIEKGPDGHIAAQAGEAIEVCNPHRTCLANVKRQDSMGAVIAAIQFI